MKKQELSLVLIGILTVLFIFSSLFFSGSYIEDNGDTSQVLQNEFVTYDKLFFID